MFEPQIERLPVFCDVCAPDRATMMTPKEITTPSPTGRNVEVTYVCEDSSCGRMYTQALGYCDKKPDSSRERLVVRCRCESNGPAMYIDQVRDDGGLCFRCWACGATREVGNLRSLANQNLP